MTTPASPTPPASSPDRRWSPWPRPRPSDPNAPNPWVKWSDQAAGFTLEGTWGGTFTGKFSPCAQITRHDSTEVKFPLPVALERRAEGLPVGAIVRLVYLGLASGKEDRSFHRFDVFVDATSIPELADLPGEDVPF
jgi:hypothetical protein